MMDATTPTQDSAYYKNLRHELVPFLPRQATRVLEVGCGEGRFRPNLPKTCEYVGVELSERAARVAETVVDRVLVGTYESVSHSLPDGYFDLVICNDVIEHMPDHDAFLDQIKNKMSANAFIVGSIPNVRQLGNLAQLLVQKNWQYTDDGILDRTHLRFFTARSWRETLAAHDFEICAMHGVNGVGYSRNLIKGLLKRALVAALGADTQYLQFAFRARVIRRPD